MASMNKGLNLPAIQKIMNDFEKESSMMDMKEEMMSDAVDDVMEDDGEDEEEEGDKILREVLDEIGVSLSQQVSFASSLSRVYSHFVSSSRMHPLVWVQCRHHSRNADRWQWESQLAEVALQKVMTPQGVVHQMRTPSKQD
jgi:hypothetical protein